MDIHRLAVLRELAERGSVTAVAQALALTPSAVSQQLKILEREAGLPLTERSGRGLALTPAGRVLAERAIDVAVALQRVESSWEEYRDSPRGEVSISTFPTGGMMLLPGLLTRLRETPGLRVAVTDQDPNQPDFAELTARYDVVLADSGGVTASWRERRLEAVELMREPLDVALPEGHPLAARVSLSPDDVISEPWIGVPVDFPFDRILTDLESLTGRPADVVQRIGDNGIVEELVAAGHGLAILPRYTTRDHGNGLVTRPLRGMRSERVIWALMRPDIAVRPSVRLVVDALRAEATAFVAARS
ncbi:LysR family transcriptional regulator [uncultured Schumannella sp.]|uniref:LysR family transcriptional regulator n=1 Tax=uncultured Schumannella sp. TaxID=1195956 RepID=UPI0025F02ABF|nr:LysR family transcriptional regulator [uncultured Schumannella sp.]